VESWLFSAAVAFAALQFICVFLRPASDIPRIKRDYEANGARVSQITPAGVEIGFWRRGHYYRKYRIVVIHPVIGRTTHLVGVSASWFSDDLKCYD